jgi:hypothetical protein
VNKSITTEDMRMAIIQFAEEKSLVELRVLAMVASDEALIKIIKYITGR